MPTSTDHRLSAPVEVALAVVGFSALAVVWSYPLIRGLTTHLPNDLGDPVLNAWILGWDATRIRHGLSGVMDAPNFFPYPHTLAYSDHLLGIAVFTAPLQWLTGNPVLVYNVAFLASIVLSGGGMYLLARTLTGRRDAALVAGVAFACTPFRVSHLAHVQWLMLGWLPLSLWALHRYFSTGKLRYLLASACAYLLQAFTAGYFIYFAPVPLAVVSIVCARGSRIPTARLAAHAVVAVATTLFVLAPVARAYYQVRAEAGLRRPMSEIAAQSADVGDYLSAPLPIRVWRWLGTRGGEHELFPGAVVACLAAVAFASRRKASAVVAYAIVALLAFVLSLGPEPTAWGHHFPWPGPYRALLAVVPGLDGLRAVARLGIVVTMALCVLAAFGSVVALDRLAPRRRTAALVAMVIAIIAEGWVAPIAAPVFAPLGSSFERDAYAYLRHSAPGAAIEIPLDLEHEEREFRRQYLTLVHGHPVVNGHSSYLPPLITFLGGGQTPLNETEHLDAVLSMLRAIGVRYMVVHLDEFGDPEVADAYGRALAEGREHVSSVSHFGRIVVAALTPEVPLAPVEALRRVPASAMRATASHSSDRLAFAFDEDPDSRWLSGTRQSGDEWIGVAFDRARDVGLIRMHLASRSFGDYPRDLAIEVEEEGGTRTVFRGPVLPQFARGLLANPRWPGIDVIVPSNQSRTIRLRQLGTTHSFYWSIHELQVWER